MVYSIPHILFHCSFCNHIFFSYFCNLLFLNLLNKSIEKKSFTEHPVYAILRVFWGVLGYLALYAPESSVWFSRL